MVILILYEFIFNFMFIQSKKSFKYYCLFSSVASSVAETGVNLVDISLIIVSGLILFYKRTNLYVLVKLMQIWLAITPK